MCTVRHVSASDTLNLTVFRNDPFYDEKKCYLTYKYKFFKIIFCTVCCTVPLIKYINLCVETYIQAPTFSPGTFKNIM